MTWIRIRENAISLGIKRLKENYPNEDDPKRQGGIIGFHMCRNLTTYADYETLLTERKSAEREIQRTALPEEYCKYRHATIQIEFVMNILRVVLGMTPYDTQAFLWHKLITKEEYNAI
jgi:hypothetical protein